MLQTEELLSAKQAASQQASELWSLANSLKIRSRMQNGSPDAAAFGDVEERLVVLAQSADRDRHLLAGMVDGLLTDMKLTLMQPFSSLLDPFPKWARDLSRDQDKEVELTITGAEIEIDRRILEEMKDPLVHMLRNAIDHGIETPAERQQAGKPRRGKITISVGQKDSSQVELIFADDGRGINVEEVKAAISKSGILSAKEVERMSEREIRRQVFNSGITTSFQVTKISGRGLGLAIVQERVNALGGQLSLQERSEGGTTLHIVLPLTIATFRGIIVRVQKEQFVLPTLSVTRVMQVKPDDFSSVGDRRTLRLDGALLPVIHLADVLEMPGSDQATHTGSLLTLIISMGGQRLALIVDELLNEQEVLVKSLGPQLSRVRNIAAATIVGSGQVVPILNVADLIKSGIKASRFARPSPSASKMEPQRLLVVDDSITSRTLLKNILETAGYQVKTAVDGKVAHRLLQRERFDLVVSDVDMPHMDGFELTTAIRDDPEMTRLPVILVTSLADPEDRQMGARVGADAYIVKSEFEQQSLLTTISSLI
jgi:two-component system chemotaxis sensor kinase CheA